jgi:hypothetical protein
MKIGAVLLCPAGTDRAASGFRAVRGGKVAPGGYARDAPCSDRGGVLIRNR